MIWSTNYVVENLKFKYIWETLNQYAYLEMIEKKIHSAVEIIHRRVRINRDVCKFYDNFTSTYRIEWIHMHK